MALRFFADHCVSDLIIESLAAVGHEVLQLKDHLPVESPDTAVIAKAQDLGASSLSTATSATLWLTPRHSSKALSRSKS